MTVIRRQNLTLCLSTQTIRNAKVLAAQRSTSVSALVAEQVEAMVHADEAYSRAAASAMARMERGFRMGGGSMVSRDDLHER